MSEGQTHWFGDGCPGGHMDDPYAPQIPKGLDYPFIRAWSRFMGSYDYYLERELAKARQDGAPHNAIYSHGDGVWVTADEIMNPAVKECIFRYVGMPLQS